MVVRWAWRERDLSDLGGGKFHLPSKDASATFAVKGILLSLGPFVFRSFIKGPRGVQTSNQKLVFLPFPTTNFKNLSAKGGRRRRERQAQDAVSLSLTS